MTDENTSAETTPTYKRRPRRRRTARGSVYQRKDGLWCGEIPLPGGKRKFVYGRTTHDVDEKLTQAKATLQAGGVVSSDDSETVSRFLDRFLDERTARGLRASTLDAYRTIIKIHLKPQLGAKRLRALTAADVQAWMAERKRAKVTPAMIWHALVVLRMALRLAFTWDLVAQNVANKVRAPRHDRPDLDPLTAEDTRRLLNVAAKARLGAIWFIAANTGMRRGEILGLRWRDIDLDAGIVYVRHQLEGAGTKAKLSPPKTKRAIRNLALAPVVVDLLRKRRDAQAAEKLKAGDDWLNALGLAFTYPSGLPLDGPRISRMHAKLCADAGVRRVRFHDLRHGAATLMIDAGVDPVNLSASLGHAKVAFTLDVYAHAMQRRVHDAVGRVAGVLGLTDGAAGTHQS